MDNKGGSRKLFAMAQHSHAQYGIVALRAQ